MRVLRYDEKDHLVTQLIQAYLPTILGFNITQPLTVVTNSEMSRCTKVQAAKNITTKKIFSFSLRSGCDLNSQSEVRGADPKEATAWY